MKFENFTSPAPIFLETPSIKHKGVMDSAYGEMVKTKMSLEQFAKLLHYSALP